MSDIVGRRELLLIYDDARDIFDLITALQESPGTLQMADEIRRMERDAKVLIGLRRDASIVIADAVLSNAATVGYFAGRYWLWSPISSDELRHRVSENLNQIRLKEPLTLEQLRSVDRCGWLIEADGFRCLTCGYFERAEPSTFQPPKSCLNCAPEDADPGEGQFQPRPI